MFSNLGIEIDFGSVSGSISKVQQALTPVINTIKTCINNLDFSGLKSLASAVLPAVQAGFETFASVALPQSARRSKQ